MENKEIKKTTTSTVKKATTGSGVIATKKTTTAKSSTSSVARKPATSSTGTKKSTTTKTVVKKPVSVKNGKTTYSFKEGAKNVYDKTLDGVKHAGEYVVDGCKKGYHIVEGQAKKVVENLSDETKKEFKEMHCAVNECTKGDLLHKDDARKAVHGVRRMCSEKNIRRGEYFISKLNIVNDDINHTVECCARTLKSFGNDSTRK